MSLQLLRKGLRLPSLAARPVRSMSSGRPQDPVRPLDIIIGLSVLCLGCMIPGGYIMQNVENYKKRE